MIEVQNESIGSRLDKVAKEKKEKEKHLVVRMWFSTFISYFFPDYIRIPENIGDNILVGNNIYITRNFLCAEMLVLRLSTETPMHLTSELQAVIKDKHKGVFIDFIFKNKSYQVNLHSSGNKSRMNQWIRTIERKDTSENSKKKAAICLYTVDVIKSREKMYRTNMYIRLRAKNGNTLKKAMKDIEEYLNGNNIDVKTIKSDIKSHLSYNSLMSSKGYLKTRDIPHTIMSATSIAELLPNTEGMNDNKGLWFGINKRNKSPYYIDLKSNSKAKNIGVFGLSGFGKTFIVTNWAMSAYLEDFNLLIEDVKGNEFDGFTEALDGIILSMRYDDEQYSNVFRLNSEDCTGDTIIYYNERFKLGKQFLGILINEKQENITEVDSLLDKFLTSMYITAGVIPDNKKTWYRTDKMDPFTVYDSFVLFCSSFIRQEYSNIIKNALERLHIYISRKGSCSHMFKREYDYKSLYKTRVLTFDFGMLNSSKIEDKAAYNLKVFFKRIIKNKFCSYKNSIGEWIFKVDEESQIVDDDALNDYVEDFTIKRAAKQVSVLLGNSIAGLLSRPGAQPILDNLNIFCIGIVPKSSQEYLINEFDLEKERDNLYRLNNDPDYEYTFLLINKMTSNSTTAFLNFYVPEEIAKGRMFKAAEKAE